MDGLVLASQEALSYFKENIQKRISRNQESKTIGFINTDFHHYDFNDANVIYLSIHPTALAIELSGRLLNKLENLKQGTRIITSNIPIPSSYFILRESHIYEFITGSAEVFFHEKIR